MTYHKIRGVCKSVCTAEQKIAYNLAFRAHISYQDVYNKAKTISGVCVSDILRQIVEQEMHEFSFSADYGKYNEDAINAALNAGIENYLNNPFIASDYATIGKAFPALYLNT